MSLAGSDRREQAKRKMDSESFEEECKRQAEYISRLKSELDEALSQCDLAINIDGVVHSGFFCSSIK